MRIDANYYGSVPMPDAGNAGPRPIDRRYGNSDFIACYENLTHWSKTMDRLGYDTMWLTEHHFQYEGYEVVPNLVLFGLYLTTQTQRLHLGQMFNIVPQWHPLHLAEDFAMADILSGGRMRFGVGRGTVPREAETFGAMVASGDNDLSREADRINREVFEESMEVILQAFANERFTFSGKHFTFPHMSKLVPRCKQFSEVAAANGFDRGPGGGRMLVLHVHAGPTREKAFRTERNGHDEFCRFLAPYGRFGGYLGQDPQNAIGYQPTLEDSVDQQIMAIGSVDDVVDTIGMYREVLDLEHLCCFFDLPGLTREQLDEQLHLFAEDVLPKLGVHLTPSP